MRLFALARWLLTLLGGLGAMLVGPGVANACACGAAIADELTPVRETALVELDGPTEHVTVNITADTTSDSVASRPQAARSRSSTTSRSGPTSWPS
jgi:hypothetical protein